MRIGIFGGSFDPVHNAHLLLAEACREQAGLDEIWFLPAAVSPWKMQARPAEAKHRVQMLRLAIDGHAAFRLCTHEVEQGGVSYTVETLRHLHAEHPHDELFLLMGADSLRDLPQWREPAAICQLALPLVVRRPAAPEPDLTVLSPLVAGGQLEQIRGQVVDMPGVQISSSDIRQRIATGHSIRYLVPRAVEKYIETQQLYRE